MSITDATFAVTDVSGLVVCGMEGVPFPGTEFVEPVIAFYLDNLVDGKLATGSQHGKFSWETTSNWHVNLHGVKLNGAAVETTHELHRRRRLTRLDSDHRALSACSMGSTVERGAHFRVLSSYASVRSGGCW